MKPIDVSNPVPAPPQPESFAAANPRANARLLRQQGAGDPIPPDTVLGANGQRYLPGAVTQADWDESQRLLNSVHGKWGANSTDTNARAGALDTVNKAWALKGYGAKASMDPRGNGQLVFSGSTTPEKMPYVDAAGNPTTDYKSTRQYAEGMEVARKDRELGNQMEADRLQRESESRPMSKYQRAAATALRNAKTQADASRYAADRAYDARKLPLEYQAQQRKALGELIARGGQGAGGTDIATQALQSSLDPSPIYEQRKAVLDINQKQQTYGHNATENIKSALKGRFIVDGKPDEEIEALAYKAFVDGSEGKTLSEAELREQIPNMIRHGNLLKGLRIRDRDHNDSLAVKLGLQKPRPLSTDLDPASPLRRLSGWDGAMTFGNVASGDWATPDGRFIPGDSEGDIPAYQASRNIAAEEAKKAKEAKKKLEKQ